MKGEILLAKFENLYFYWIANLNYQNEESEQLVLISKAELAFSIYRSLLFADIFIYLICALLY